MNETATIEIAGVAMGVSADSIFAEAVRERYSSFLTRRGPDFSITVSVDGSIDSIISPLKVKRESGSRYSLDGALRGAVDIAAGRAEIVLPPDIFALDGFLRLMLGTLFLRRGGFLLHAAGVEWRGGAVVFFGESESGKTTLAGLCEGAPVLSDEVVAVATRDGDVSAHSTPFHGKWRGGEFVPPSPVCAFVSPRKGDRLLLERIAPPVAAKEILRQVIFHPAFNGSAADALENVARAASEIPCFALTFSLQDDLSEVMDELVAVPSLA